MSSLYSSDEQKDNIGHTVIKAQQKCDCKNCICVCVRVCVVVSEYADIHVCAATTALHLEAMKQK